MRYNFTPLAQKALQMASESAKDMKNAYIGTEHLLLGLLTLEESSLYKELEQYGMSYQRLKEDLIILFGFNDEAVSELEYTKTMEEILEACVHMASDKRETTIDEDMLAFSLLQAENNVAVELLKRYNVDIDKIICKVQKQSTVILEKIHELRNLNEWVMEKGSVVISREKELQLIMNILCRKEKANPLLIGDPGVGKTAIVEELAKRIVLKKVPVSLMNCIVFELNVNSLVAGTKYRGEFEEKIQKIVEYLTQIPQAILFVDEIHQMIGAGKAEGSIDVAGVLKPYLARGLVRCIGATTYDEYTRFIEKDKALERRFQVVHVDEPSEEAATLMIEAKIQEYQSHHHVTMNKEFIPFLIQSCQYYLPQRKLPDKAIDILDLACVNASIHHREEVVQADIYEVLQQLTDIPLLSGKRVETTMNCIRKSVFGCEEAIQQIEKQMKWIDLGRIDQHPLGIWLFMGENVSLKKEIVRILTQEYFNHKSRLIEVDMLEYQSQQAGLQFIQAGESDYVTWITKLKRNPYSIVYLDNIHKSHSDCITILNKAMEEGYIEDSKGSMIDMRHCILILSINEKVTNSSVGFIDQRRNAYLREDIMKNMDIVCNFYRVNDDDLRKMIALKICSYPKEWWNVNQIEEILEDCKQDPCMNIEKKIKEKMKNCLIESVQ